MTELTSSRKPLLSRRASCTRPSSRRQSSSLQPSSAARLSARTTRTPSQARWLSPSSLVSRERAEATSLVTQQSPRGPRRALRTGSSPPSALRPPHLGNSGIDIAILERFEHAYATCGMSEPTKAASNAIGAAFSTQHHVTSCKPCVANDRSTRRICLRKAQPTVRRERERHIGRNTARENALHVGAVACLIEVLGVHA